MPDLKATKGYKYLQETKFRLDEISSMEHRRIAPCDPFKTYPEAETVSLPPPVNAPADNLWDVLQKRRSARRFQSEKLLTLQNLGLLAWAAQGLTARAGNFFLRTAPSAGALYPIETYMAVENVEGLNKGIYHLDVQNFALNRLTTEPPGEQAAQAALGQGFIAKANVSFIWSAVLRRNMSKYGDRGLRYILLDAGHICQNLLLAAEALGLAACPVAAFDDGKLNTLLGLDGDEETTIYLAALGARPDSKT